VEDQREHQLPERECSSAAAQCAFLGGPYERVIGLSDTPQNLYWKNRSYSELARALARLGQLPPSPQLHALMAGAFREQGRHAEAAQELQNGLKLDPGSVRLRTLLAAELWRGRDFEAARPVLERWLAVTPDSAELNYELGDLHLQQAEPEKALPLLEKGRPAQAGTSRRTRGVGAGFGRRRPSGRRHSAFSGGAATG
jgi:tetratricopeptide (TPR) repeat protein